jgi:hypothetical protein
MCETYLRTTHLRVGFTFSLSDVEDAISFRKGHSHSEERHLLYSVQLARNILGTGGAVFGSLVQTPIQNVPLTPTQRRIGGVIFESLAHLPE